MRLVCLSHYGNSTGLDSAANSLLHMLLAYSKRNFSEITKLVCNGCFSFCARDVVDNTSLRSCTKCEKEQRQLAHWSGIDTLELSSFIDSDDVATVSKKVNAGGDALKVRQHDIIHISKRSVESLGVNGENLAQTYWGAGVSVLTALKVARRLKPDIFITTNSSDFIAQAFIDAFNSKGIKVACFDTSSCGTKIVLRRYHDMEERHFDIFIESLDNVRNDSSTWASEIVDVLQSSLEFLNLQSNQLTLPLGR